VSGDHDHDDIGIQLAGTGEDLHPIDPGHLEVGEDDLGALALEQRQRALTVGRRHAGIVVPAEEAAPVGDDVRLVVDDQDAWLGAHKAPAMQIK
jgi:hypothetical protein